MRARVCFCALRLCRALPVVPDFRRFVPPCDAQIGRLVEAVRAADSPRRIHTPPPSSSKEASSLLRFPLDAGQFNSVPSPRDRRTAAYSCCYRIGPKDKYLHDAISRSAARAFTHGAHGALYNRVTKSLLKVLYFDIRSGCPPARAHPSVRVCILQLKLVRASCGKARCSAPHVLLCENGMLHLVLGTSR